jgi:hypothetical protein
MIDYVARVLRGINAAGSISAYAKAIGVSRTTVYGVINGSNPTRQTKAKINGFNRRASTVAYAPTADDLPKKRANISRARAKILFARAKAAGLNPRATITIKVRNARLEAINRDTFYGNSKKGVDEAERIAMESMKDVAEQRYGFEDSEYFIDEIIYSVFW